MEKRMSLGLDIGTTTVSAVVADPETKEVLAALTQNHNADLPAGDPGERLQSPRILETVALRLLEALLDRYPQIGSIGITGQMHGILYLDDRGEPVSPLYTWQDRRGEELCPRLRQLTGYAAAPGYGLVTHCALEQSGQLPEGAWKLCTVMDYLTFRLCGKKRLLMHATNAASLGFYNLRESCFDRDALRKIGVDPALLPEVTRDAQVVGFFRDIPVTVAIGDNQASFLGAVPDPESTVLANFGTGSQISLVVRDLTGVREDGSVEIRPFLKDSYLLCGSALCGGRAYAMLEKFFRSFAIRCGLGDEDVYEVLNEMSDRGLRQRELPRVEPTFCGTRQDPTVRGSIGDIGPDNFTPEAFAAGLLVGMAQELHSLYSRMPHEGIGAVMASGNAAAKNPALLRALERVFSLPVSGCENREEAAFGAACFASARIWKQ